MGTIKTAQRTILSILLLCNLSTELSSTEQRFRSIVTVAQCSTSYICSVDGMRDSCAAYLLGMSVTLVHELGHAYTHKLWYGGPINVTIGASTSDKAYAIFYVGGITLGGFNPTTGFTSYHCQRDPKFPLRNASISLAGSLISAGTSAIILVALQKYVKALWITKAAICFSIFNQTVGPAGLTGLFLRLPNHDFTNAWKHIMEWRHQAK
jgi:hypothetical protein